MIEITAGKNDAGQRLDRFLNKCYPRLTQGVMRSLLRKKNIKVNNARPEAAYKLQAGDIIRLYVKDGYLSEPDSVKITELSAMTPLDEDDIIYEDENILLIDKKPGLVVHEDNEKSKDTLINRVTAYLYQKGEYAPENEKSFAPALCNRIDRNTGGIVIAAKNAESLRIMNQKIKDRELVKLYLCVISGSMEKPSGTMTAYLEKIENENRVVISDKKTHLNKTVRTRYRVIDTCGFASLVEVELLTGRTHQIRAHFAHVGHPLLGDGKYGSNRLNKKYGYKYQALYSCKLIFSFTTDGGILNGLNGKSFEVRNVWFKDKYYKDKNKTKEG